MRSRFIPLLVFSFVTGTAILGISFGVVVHQGRIQPLSQADAQSSLNPIGPWNLIVTFPDGSQSSSTMRYYQNGTLTVYTPGPGTGTWSMTSSNQFQYTFTEKILDSQGNQTGYVDVQQQATLSNNGKTYTAFGTGTVYSMNGSVQAVNHTTTQATRA